MRSFLTRALIVLGCATAIVCPARVLAYTSPGQPTGYVNDFAGVLSAESEARLEELVAEHERQYGHEIAIVTTPSLKDETIESYAEKLFREWGIGKKAQDNGVLILVAPSDRKMRIEVGYGLEAQLTDADSASIITAVKPLFVSGDTGGGVMAMGQYVLQNLSSDAGTAASPAVDAWHDDKPEQALLLVSLIPLGIVIVLLLLFWNRRGRSGGGSISGGYTSSSFGSSSRSRSSSSSSFGGGRSGGGGASGSW